jgi:segregation and condensation protein A
MGFSDNSPPRVEFHEFGGTLDLLLDEVRRQNVAIEEIAMAPIVARFLDYLRTAAERNLNLDIEWLHMAATLIYWKSQSVLPQSATGDLQKDPIRDELIEQLLKHRKEAADVLSRRMATEENRFSRPADREAEPVPAEPACITVWDLIGQARDLASWVEQEQAARRHWQETFGVDLDEVTIGDMIHHLRGLLSSQGCLEAVGLLQSEPNVARRCCMFLGMLEMAREQEVDIQQDEAFGLIHLTASR